MNFVVHVDSFDLVISKNDTEDIDKNQPFLFRITGPDSFSMDVVVVGNDEVVIKGLPVGVYQITEITDWQYAFSSDDGTKEADSQDAVDGQITVDMNNTKVKDYWLDGTTHIVNHFNKVSH